MRLLNIGCGTVRPPAPWFNVDPDPQYIPLGEGYVADPLKGLPFDDGYFDGAVAHHVLMMIPWVDLPRWLAEVRRVTRGPLRVSVPNIEAAITALDQGPSGRPWFPVSTDDAPTTDDAFCLYVTQGGATRSIFTWPRLVDMLTSHYGPVSNGHHPMSMVAGLDALDSRIDESWIAEAW